MEKPIREKEAQAAGSFGFTAPTQSGLEKFFRAPKRRAALKETCQIEVKCDRNGLRKEPSDFFVLIRGKMLPDLLGKGIRGKGIKGGDPF